MQECGHFVVAQDHACLPGHFPGRPIVPGVVLLDTALSLVLAALPPCRLAGVTSAKFLTVVPPGQRVEVHRGPLAGIPGRLEFACRVDGATVASGAALLAALVT